MLSSPNSRNGQRHRAGPARGLRVPFLSLPICPVILHAPSRGDISGGRTVVLGLARESRRGFSRSAWSGSRLTDGGRNVTNVDPRRSELCQSGGGRRKALGQAQL